METLLTLQAVLARTAIKSKSHLYAKVADNSFPKPVKTGERAVAWVASEVHQWIDQRIAERGAA